MVHVFLHFIELSLCFCLKTFDAADNMTFHYCKKKWISSSKFSIAQKGWWTIVIGIAHYISPLYSGFYSSFMTKEWLKRELAFLSSHVNWPPVFLYTHVCPFALSWLPGNEHQRELEIQLSEIHWNNTVTVNVVFKNENGCQQ